MEHKQRNTRAALAWQTWFTAALLCVNTAALAQSKAPVGEVEAARGVGFAQTSGQAPRTLGKGLTLQEGDRLTTAQDSSAIVKMQDGTRMTIRPNSELVLTQYKFKENASDNNMLLSMIRGGLRAITGLISKTSPNAARIQTSTATIGIRGTDFDARLCGKDCAAESARITNSARPNAPQASAKVVIAQGNLSATDSAGQKRSLVAGGSVYPGDLLETTVGSHAVLAFRDDSRLTLGSGTRFRVDSFVYDDKNAKEGRFLVSLLRGSLRALTGLIGKSNTQNVRFNTATATIGIRGTGLDLNCTGACAGEPGDGSTGLSVFTWLGSVVVDAKGRTALEVLLAGEGLFISLDKFEKINKSPNDKDPRPDQVDVPGNLFSGQDLGGEPEGLYVFVRDGHIEVLTSKEVLHLGKGEAGFAGDDGRVVRPFEIPKFIDFDKISMPDAKTLQSILLDSGLNKSFKVCK